MKYSFLFFMLWLITPLCSQEITIQPYLQDAEPHSIYVLWETTEGEESIVEWGLSESLGNTAQGISYVSEGTARVHEVQLTNLERFTKYYYRVKTGDAVSAIFHFKTPPFASDKESFRILAMSDMQKDASQPNKFQEIVEQGVLQYLDAEYGGDLTDNISLVMIPGDLVVTGTNFSQWKNDFFNPAENLLSYVPVYPVLGNHENNTQYYFTYFKTPENGTEGYEEHWWYKDYGNTRLIGLDSNGPFNNEEQLEWLDNTLELACEADSIDFVFAELHHPHKSELWTPGESDFTGEVIARLEQFTSNCNKPSIHFFGHTHGYSRGQSRDHKHLWINVATAGGAIDNWGEFPNFDYDEFSVSQDEYGFVLVEITDDEDPKLTIKRINRGDEETVLENYISDSLTLRLNPSIVNTPVPQFPVDEDALPLECVVLQANAFSAPNSIAEHGQSHWQVTTSLNGFDNPVAENWLNFENWYYDVDTQAEDDLTDEKILGLEENTEYWWRVRYRDKEMNWSAWSEPATFTTGLSLLSPNLLMNAGAEEELAQWIVAEGVVETPLAEACDGIAPHSGEKYFAVGGICEHSEVGRAYQDVDVSDFAEEIDAAEAAVNFGGYLSNFSGSDIPEMKVVFLSETLNELGQSNAVSSQISAWTLYNERVDIPALTRFVRLELKGTRNAGTDNDSYFDDLFMRVGARETECETESSVVALPYITDLKITPNPMDSQCFVQIPPSVSGKVSLYMIDVNGRKIKVIPNRQNDAFLIEKGNLAAGTYALWLREEGRLVGRGKVVIK